MRKIFTNYLIIFLWYYHVVCFKYLFYFRWRRSFSSATYCDQNTIQTGNLYGPTANIVCRSGCARRNEVVGTTAIICTAFSVTDDWTYGTHTFTYNFIISDANIFSFIGSSWANLVVFGYNPSTLLGWEIRCRISTINRTDTGTVNNAPMTVMAPVITVNIYLYISKFLNNVCIFNLDT